MQNTIKQYWDVFSTLVKNNFVREFIYRANSFAMAFADLIWVAVEYAFFEVIYSNINQINGWTREQTFFFLGIFISSDALFTTLFQRTFWQFPYLINQGDLDVLLTKPVNTVFLATLKELNFTQVVNLGLGFWIIHHYGPAAGFNGGIKWIGVLFWIFIGLWTQYMVRFCFVVASFWMERGLTVSRLYYQFYALANKPEGLYPTAIRMIIKTALPFAFLGSLPSRALTGRMHGGEYFLVLGVLCAYVGICVFLWKRGLRKYQSASS
jgi:ABC-2 type transport system permease protein